MALFTNWRAADGLQAGGRGIRWRLPMGSRGGLTGCAVLRAGIGLAGAGAIGRFASAGGDGLRHFA
ncbi:MAG: hypothetical protein OXG78_06945 [Chloroflexi bacterium]|nr:hypothetical protein [Chloroflexota bacterium]